MAPEAIAPVPLKVEVNRPELLVLPVLGVRKIAGMNCVRVTGRPGVGLFQLSVRLAVTLSVWHTRIAVGTTVKVKVVGTFGWIRTCTVPLIEPVIAVRVSRAGAVAEKTVTFVVVTPLT